MLKETDLAARDVMPKVNRQVRSRVALTKGNRLFYSFVRGGPDAGRQGTEETALCNVITIVKTSTWSSVLDVLSIYEITHFRRGPTVEKSAGEECNRVSSSSFLWSGM